MDFSRKDFMNFKQKLFEKQVYHNILWDIYRYIENEPNRSVFDFRCDTSKDYTEVIKLLKVLNIEAEVNIVRGVIEINYTFFTDI